jgi:hypothetical protein
VGRVTSLDTASLAAIGKVKVGQVVQLPLAQGELVQGRVNLVQKDRGWTRIGGSLSNGAGTFAFSTNGAKTQGLVQQVKRGVAHEVGSPQGEASSAPVTSEVLIPAVICNIPRPRNEPMGIAASNTIAAGPVPTLNSKPSSVSQLYLDFDGETVTDPHWNGGATIQAASYNLSDAHITAAFERVKDDFAPFDINVTTDAQKYASAPVGRRMRCIITPSSSWYGNVGGVAYFHSFARAGSSFSSTIPCWVFNSSVVGISEAVSHEFGHTFGLNHDGRNKTDGTKEEYYEGHGTGATGWAPIMGAGYYKPLVQWSKGEYSLANNPEDDVAIITNAANGFGFAADEAGDSRGSSAALPATDGAISGSGIVAQASDSDYYSFATVGGTVSINAVGNLTSSNLDVSLELQNASGTIVAAANPADALNASLSASVPAGAYYLIVKGTGVGSPLGTGYTNYGSAGAYTLSGSYVTTHSLGVNDVSMAEGNSGQSNAIFTVSLSGPHTQAVTVGYSTSDGTATAGSDYTSTSGSLSFTPGVVSQTVAVPVQGDLISEGDETFFLNLNNGVNAIIRDAQGVCTLVDDDITNDFFAGARLLLNNSGSTTDDSTEATSETGEPNHHGLPARRSRWYKWTPSASGTTTFNTYGSNFDTLLAVYKSGGGGLSGLQRVASNDQSETAQYWDQSLVSFEATAGTQYFIAVDGWGGASGSIVLTWNGPATPNSVSIDDVTIVEGNTGVADAIFTVTLSPASAQTVTVDYATANGTTNPATAGSDYTSTSGTLSFAPGVTSLPLAVSIIGDTILEQDETFVVNLSNVVNATFIGGKNRGLGTIVDDEARVQFSASAYNVVENVGSATITVTRSGLSSSAVSVSYATANGSATAGSDYTHSSGTLNFGAGETSKTFAVPITNDALDEAAETINLALSNAGGGATLGTPATATLSIADDDAAPTLSINDVSINEGNTGSANATFTVSLSSASGQTVSVDYASAAGTTNPATAGADYTTASGTLTFTAGQTSNVVLVQVLGDTVDEENETVRVVLSNASNAGLADDTGVLSIVDDDASPTISVAPATLLEGDSGTANMSFAVTLSAISGRAASASFATSSGGASGTATAGSDYTSTSGVVSFDPGQTSKTILVPIVGDLIDEDNETFTLTLSAPANATLATASTLGTITDDDTRGIIVTPTTAISVSEGATTAAFTLKLATQPASNVSIGIESSNTLEGTVSPSTCTFTAANWNTAQTVTVTGVNDDDDDGDQTFTVRLLPATSADAKYNGLDAPDLSATNVDNDTAAVVTTAATSNTSESGASATFTLKLATRPASNVTITLTSSDTSEGTVSPSTCTFTTANWNTAQTVTVTGVNDNVADGNKAYEVRFAVSSTDTAYNNKAVTPVALSNTDNDTAALALAIAPASFSENAGATAAVGTVTRNTSSTNSLEVTLASSDATSVTVPATVTIPANQSSITFAVAAIDDAVDEDNVSVTITASAAGVQSAQQALSVQDDDTVGITVVPVLVAPATALQTREDGTSASFRLSLNSRPTANVSIALTSSDTAEGTVSPSTCTFTSANWNTPQTVTVAGVDDAVDDGDIAYSIITGAAVSADPKYSGLAVPDVAITNLNNESTQISIQDAILEVEGDTGTQQLLFNVDLSVANTRPIQVQWQTQNHTAVAGADFAGASGVLEFAPGITRRTLSVAVTGDVLEEENEKFYVALTRATNDPPTTFSKATGTATITDDDAARFLSIQNAGAPEGDAGTTNLNFVVALSSPSSSPVTVHARTKVLAGAGAASANDFEAITDSTITIPKGSVSANVVVVLRGDKVYEGDETFHLELFDSQNAALAGGQGAATVTIQDDDPLPDITGFSPLSGAVGTSVTIDGQNFEDVLSVKFNGTSAVWTRQSATRLTATVPNGATTGGISVTTEAGTGTSTANFEMPLPGGVLRMQNASLSVSEGAGTATISVTRTGGSSGAVSVGWAASVGTAGSGDFGVASGTLAFADSEAIKSFAVTITEDAVDEADESFLVTLSNPGGGASLDASNGGDRTSVTIVDNDSTPTLSINDVAVAEGNAGTSNATFTVTLSAPSARIVTVDYATANGTTSPATAGSDYASTSGKLSFAPGATTATATVSVTGDARREANETFAVNLSNPFNAAIAAGRGVGTILDDDQAGVVITPTAGLVTSEAGGAASFSVKLSSQPTANVTLSLSSSNPGEGSVSAAALLFTSDNWSLPQTVTVTGVNDDVRDGSASYTIQTGAPAGADADYSAMTAAAVPDVSVTNTDNDTVGITVSPTAGLITTEAGGQATFSVRLNTQPTADVAIGLSSTNTGEGTISPASLVFTAANWNTPQIATVSGVEDAVVDGPQSYAIVTAPAQSTDPAYLALDAADVAATNEDNDTGAFALSLASATVAENGGSAATTGTITRNFRIGEPLTVALSSTRGEVSVPATVTFGDRDVTATFPIGVVDNAFADGNRSATITATVEAFTASQPLNVSDDESLSFTLTLARATVAENFSGRVRATLARNTPTTDALTVALSSSDVSEARVPPSITIPVGAASASFLISPFDDLFADGARQVTISAQAAGIVAPATAVLTVTDNEVPALSLSIKPERVAENGVATAVLMRNTEITPATAALTATIAMSVPGQATTPLTVTIPARAASVSFTVRAVDDKLVDGPRVVTLTARAVGLATASADVVVQDNEAASKGSISGLVVLPAVLGARPVPAVPVPGAVLTLRQGSVLLDRVATAANGTYILSGLPAGTYTVSAAKPGFTFAPTSRVVVLSMGSNNVIQPAANINFAGVARAQISGALFRTDDEKGKVAIANANVVARSALGSFQARTNSAGAFVLDNLPLGSYTVAPLQVGTVFDPKSRVVALTPVAPIATGTDFGVSATTSVADITVPLSATVSQPAASSFIGTAISTLAPAGTAVDNSGGSGLALVTIAMGRFSSSSAAGPSGFLKWSGATFITADDALLVESLASGTASWKVSDPGTLAAMRSLPAGFYGIRATAVDNAGNLKRSAWKRFQITSSSLTRASVAGAGAEHEAISGERLSSATADTTQSSVTLSFVGALEAASATDATRYLLLVDGQQVAAESVSMSGTRVVLAFPNGSLRSGASVEIRWDRLRDTSGKLLQGSAIVNVP